ncbi:hypothetical protein [Arthrospiribacter ruber]|uniref:glycoside hydrolase family 130 protein n=1 Tax=Arthrospiribacter ruber TaxID=2487934 RepID=UPI001C5B6447|nr:hypothetical protein [Arthrospiribacter ruber]
MKNTKKKLIWSSDSKIIPLRIGCSLRYFNFSFLQKRRIYSIRISLKKIKSLLKYVPEDIKETASKQDTVLLRVPENPILSPSTSNLWESQAVFNPASVLLKNQVHFIYRAIGESGISVFGYASSKSGTKIDKKSDIPSFVINRLESEIPLPPHPYATKSGGSFYGCEDPRLTVIEDKVYMTFTAFDGHTPPRVALSSIKKSDFLKKEWNWSIPKFISAPGITNKNWVIFPERIHGKYAILHSINPVISIAYLNSLDFESGQYIQSQYSPGGREGHWDNWVRGAGPPPFRIDDGWMVIYHAMDKRDPDKYKLGAMILDRNNPEKILYRSEAPILEPELWYENEGHKRGVVYSCGASIIKNKLIVYYGGSDSYICAASCDLKGLISKIKGDNKHTELKTIKMKRYATVSSG